MAASAAAQSAPPAQAPAAQRRLIDMLTSGQWKLEQLSQDHWRLTGDVEFEPPDSMIKFSADVIELFTDTNRVVASGNVVFSNPEGQIAAERVEFDVNANTGTFFQASGIMSLGETVDRTQFANQDPDVYFYGDTIEKLSARQYRISRGGFTTCVQPTPRWEVVSKSVTINLDDYAVARNIVLRVKGVPLMYLPVIYYPIQDDERATGFLMPTYGTSILQGQAISNAFFWAIGRSHDATFFHDWYTRAGQGVGAEYRYQSNLSSYGNFRAYRFAQRETSFTEDATVTRLPESLSYRVQGTMVQTLGPNIRARARADYFTNLLTQQIYQQNVYYATQPFRVVEAGLSASFGRTSTSLQYLRNELFSSEENSTVYGSTPRATVSLAPQMLFGAPIYGSVNGEYAFLPNRRITDGEITFDQSLARADLSPTLRIPMSRLTYLSVNTSAAYRTTYYTRSRDENGTQVPEGLIRQFLNVRSDIIGPVLTKIWDTPESRSTERMKHVIEPTFSVEYVTPIQDQVRTPITSDVSDFIVGGAARLTYGVNNRLFYRGRPRENAPGMTREFVTIGVQQTYYTDPLSSNFDTTYVSAGRRPRPVDLSPVAVTARVTPSSRFDTTTRLEYDVSGNGLQILTAGGNVQLYAPTPVGGGVSPRSISANISFNRARYSPSQRPDKFLSLSTTSRWLDSRVGANYSLSWDIARGYIVTQSVMASYMAQCCGIQVDFQKYDFQNVSGIGIPSDRRFNFSFVLAGLGTFSNFFGAFGQR